MSGGAYVDGPRKTFTAGAAIGQWIRVKISSGVLAIAGITDRDIGVLAAESFASGERRAVDLVSKTGTQLMVANNAITAGALVYTAANGKISPTFAATSYLRGIAMEAAGADGDIIEVLPLIGDVAGT